MTIWVIIPVKPFDQGKSRLRALFPADELFQFNDSLFQSTFLKLKNKHAIDHILVVSRDRQTLDWSVTNGGEALLEDGTQDLNDAILQALRVIQIEDPGPVLILPTDLPLMTGEDLDLLISYAPHNPGVLIVPDRRQTGTNALYLSRPDLLPTAFGHDSFFTHCALAEERHLQLVVYLNQHIQHDIDTPEDLEVIRDQFMVNPISVF